MSQETILLVEDNPDDAELALMGFGKSDSCYDIEVVNSGEDALEFLFATGKHQGRSSARNPGLIFLDIKLPGINGLTVLQRLRNHPCYQHTPVVILTTSDERSDIVTGYKLGVNSYLQKPVDFAAFADLLQQVSEYWLNPNISSSINQCGPSN